MIYSMLTWTARRSCVIIERARLRRLAWADAPAAAALAAEPLRSPAAKNMAWWRGPPPPAPPTGFDLVLGADVVYVEEAVPALFATATALLSSSPQVTLP